MTVNDKRRTYGDDNPTLDATVTNWVPSGDPVNYTLSTTAVKLSGLVDNHYPVTVTPGVNPNYDVTVVAGKLTIDPRMAWVSANAVSRPYGDPNPVFTATVTGEVPGGDLVQYSLSTTATQFSAVAGSPYAILVTLGANPNYSVKVPATSGALTITRRLVKVVRYQAGEAAPRIGWHHEDKVGDIEGQIFDKYRRMSAKTPVADVKLLAPVLPGKILCVGRNYVEHAKELGNDVPRIPLIFMKPRSAIIGPGEAIVLPPQSQQVEHEAELVVVIGKRGRNITAEESGSHIFGYTVGNDVTARDLQKTDDQWTRAKGFDTFCPFGPWIDTDFDAADAVITCRVNGQPRQMASTRDVVFSVPTLIAYISSVMTLEPWDLIFTGTPAGVACGNRVSPQSGETARRRAACAQNADLDGAHVNLPVSTLESRVLGIHRATPTLRFRARKMAPLRIAPELNEFPLR